eukprot:NODE_762_length_4102_cov_1.465401.p7 type:complete len:100 gc:universal NODE_762_length_4102_cov_1.465401:3699-3400(-)
MLILNQACEFDYKAYTNCDVYTITYDVYYQICQAYPAEAEKVLNNTRARYSSWKETSKKWLRKVDKKDNPEGRRKSSFAFFLHDVREDPKIAADDNSSK